MSDEEVADDRHPIEAAPEVKAKVMEDFRQGAKESGFGRRKLIRNTMFGALAVVPLSGVVLLRDLGPLPEKKLRTTGWKKASAWSTSPPTSRCVPRTSRSLPDVRQARGPGGGRRGVQHQDRQGRPDARADPAAEHQGQAGTGLVARGIVAYSKICTHVGCPISLYEQQTHHVLCPCHQSTFDLSDGGRVIFGPAGHALPQLHITVKDGFLEAVSDFAEPVGPSFWERG